jgi:hypothetical protein
MTMRALKTKFPCRGCGVPSEVATLAEAATARCPDCRERDRLVTLCNLLDTGAERTLDEVARDDDSPEAARAARYLHAAEEFIRAARALLEAVPVSRRWESRKMVRFTLARIRRARAILDQMPSVIDAALDEQSHGLRLVQEHKTPGP